MLGFEEWMSLKHIVGDGKVKKAFDVVESQEENCFWRTGLVNPKFDIFDIFDDLQV